MGCRHLEVEAALAERDTGVVTSAAERWAEQLAAWAIPEDVLARAPEPPWGFPTAIFARRVVANRSLETPDRVAARQALGEGGSVLDVGAGAGAASLALVPPATSIVAVDAEPTMLEELERQARALPAPGGGSTPPLSVRTVLGRWPGVADLVEPQDVAVCHHVVYNVADIAPFVSALAARARRRTVLVLPEDHPLSWMRPLWARFWGMDRPDGPTAEDLLEVLGEQGISPQVRWFEDAAFAAADTAEERAAQLLATRRRLCLTADRDTEIAEALDELPRRARRVVAVWWDTFP